MAAREKWFRYIGPEGERAPNGIFHFRGVNFDVDGTPKRLTDAAAIAKAQNVPELEEVDAPASAAVVAKPKAKKPSGAKKGKSTRAPAAVEDLASAGGAG